MTNDLKAFKNRKEVRNNDSDRLYSRKRKSLTLEELMNKYLHDNKATA